MGNPAEDLAFVGTYTDGASDGIYTIALDRAAGTLRQVGEVYHEPNPSFLTLGPNREFGYAVNEVEDGMLTSFSINPETKALERLNGCPTGRSGPCHVSVDATGREAYVANYLGGAVSVFSIEDGRVQERLQCIDHTGSGPHPVRQTEPHPHSAVPDPENRRVYVPDLGTDEVVIYERNSEGGLGRMDVQTVHEGAGPRHVAFHPTAPVLYVLNELDSTITTFRRDRETGSLTPLQTVGTVPENFGGENLSAEILVHPDGKWVFASNRGHDSIAILSVEPSSGALTREGTEPTRGASPRHFTIDSTGEMLLVCNRDSDGVVPFAVDYATGGLSPLGDPVPIPSPSCVRFL